MFVAAFGKHPGWNDHIDDLGLETPTLVDLKHRLYVAGIGGNIDGGTWDKLSAEQQLEGFDHVFVWRAPGDIVVGRMWSSKDGKGRAKYPMIVCAEFRGYPLATAITEGLPALERLRERCVATTDAGEVRQALDESRARLRDRVRAAAGGPELNISDRVLAELAADPAMGADGVGVLRVLYQVEREMADYAAMGGTQTRARAVDPRPQHIRVPACAPEPGDAAQRWVRAMLAQISPAAELLLLVPVGRPWVDVIVGRADPASLYGLRASPRALALTTEIPYALDETFIERARRRLEAAPTDAERPLSAAGRAASSPGADGSPTAGRKLLLVAIVLIALAGAVAAIGLLMNRNSGSEQPSAPPPAAPPKTTGQAPPPASPEHDAAWRELCTAYHSWVALFTKRLDERLQPAAPDAQSITRRERYKADPELARLLDTLARDGADPWSIAGVPQARDLLALARAAPEAARTPESARRTAASLAAIRGISNALGGGWSRLASLRAAADRFERAGWGGAARAIRRAAEQTAPGSTREVALAVDDVLTASAMVERIDQGWSRVARHTEATLASGDRVLESYGRFTQETTAAAGAAEGMEGLAALAQAVAVADTVGERLGEFLARDWPVIDQEAFRTSRVHQQFAGAATPETFESWLFEVRSYPSLDPSLNPTRPEGGWGAPARLAESDALITRLRDEFGIDPPADAVSALRALRRRVEELKALPFIRANEARIRQEADAIAAEADALWEGLNTRLEAANATRVSSAAEARAKLAGRERVAANSEAINSVWRAWAQALLGAYPEARYPEMLAAAQGAETFLSELNRRMPAGLDPAPSPRPWHEGLAAAAHAERERRLTATLSAWPTQPPAGGADDLRAADAAAADFSDWLAALGSMRADLDRAEELLARAGADPGGDTPWSLVQRWESRPVWSAPGIRDAVAPVTSRIAETAALGALSDRVALVAAVDRAEPTRPELPVAAWRRLGALADPAWPAGLGELRTERRLAQTIERVAGAMRDEAGRAALLDELARESRVRWQRAAAAARTPAEIRAVLEFRRDMRVGPDDISDPRTRYNALILDLEAAARAPGLDDARARTLARDFAAAVRALPVAATGTVPAVLQEMDAIASAEDGPAPVDVTRIGPGSVPGWTGALLTPDGGWVRYSPGAGASARRPLDFVRVANAPGAPGEAVSPVYLCTIETPISLVAELSADAAFAAAMAELLPTGERAGPVGWALQDGGLTLAAAWISRFPGGTSGADYPELLIAGFPADDHPIQHVSPAAAMFIAKALGCRLPTSAEWRIARSTMADAVWNLRDARWRRQWGSADAVHKRGRIPVWPDAGTFWPSPGPEGIERPAVSGPKATGGDVGLDDGYLLFAPGAPDAGSAFQHLIGNTAEFVYEDAAGFEQLADGTPAEVQRFAQSTAGRLGVVGGSALWPPELDVERTWPVDLFDVQDRAGYSDVGFRLAFSAGGPSAPRLSAAARILAQLSDAAFLAP